MFEEKDFVIQQIQGIAKTLGKFLGLEQVKEIINLNQEQQETLTDKELESILAAAKIENILMNSPLTAEAVAQQLDIEAERLDLLLNNEIAAEPQELTRILEFIDNNSQYL